LYFKEDAPPGAIAAEISGEVSREVKERVKRDFVVGPMVEKSFWAGERRDMTGIDRGPCK